MHAKMQCGAFMLRSEREVGIWKHATSLAGREIAPPFPISLLTLSTLMRLVIGLVIACLIVIGLTSPSGGQTPEHVRAEPASSWPQQQEEKASQFGRCLQDWDIGTHMTKQQWRGACHRLLVERGDYLPNLRQ
jgi:hypothetical protein